ncbi:ammonia-forming cytochrome c nitrite reductase subunit c552 [Methanococcoides orientis]|uniref:cytochrome c3 family protein n=1 Tax=Methanococcoides orientis TaxID=2822137 RepID=UPI001E320339|nr:cytochrome c3 family protein [Methanococcoides orientis]UGV40963.1 ammonia-forming cytochrome c nitrite reductase subunit c552 [Methanococcoides orientis]
MCIAVDFDDCTDCHQESYDQWSSSAHGTADCEICHTPAEGGFDGHVVDPSGSVPTADLSSEVCGDCHAAIFDEWNEFAGEEFDMEAMASHSEPTEVAEPYVLHSDVSCVVCKSTDGAILNLEEAEVYMLNEEAAHDLEVTEWAIACVACHDPHEGGLWLEESTLLCGNCHNTEGVVADGKTPVVRHAQWDMVSTSVYVDGTHPTGIGCVDCHMSMVPLDGEVTTGHDFDFDAVALSDPDSSNECYSCHLDSLSSSVEVKQETVSQRLSYLNSLKEESNVVLESFNGTDVYGPQLANYNNGLFYLTEVENDGSLGIHNMFRTEDDLDMAERYFNLVIGESLGVDEPVGQVPAPGGIVVVMIFATVAFLIKRD